METSTQAETRPVIEIDIMEWWLMDAAEANLSTEAFDVAMHMFERPRGSEEIPRTTLRAARQRTNLGRRECLRAFFELQAADLLSGPGFRQGDSRGFYTPKIRPGSLDEYSIVDADDDAITLRKPESA